MNDPNPVVEEALRWLRFSEEDLSVAARLMSGAPTAPRHACWLSQQAAEKALKAALMLEEVDFAFTHDLDALRNLLPDGWSVRDTHADLAELTEWQSKPGIQAIGRNPMMTMRFGQCLRPAPSTTPSWRSSGSAEYSPRRAEGRGVWP